jgi:iron complex transport system permease protein
VKKRAKGIVKAVSVYAICAAVILLLLAVSVTAGSGRAGLGRVVAGVFSGGDSVVNALISVNMPRAWVALFSGAALAVAGALFQTVTRNPLADPSIIGISSSAYACGLFVSLAFPLLIPYAPLFSAAFAMLVFLLIFWLSYSGGLKAGRVLAVGAAVNAVFVVAILTAAVMQNLGATGVLLSLTGSLSVPLPSVVASTAILTSAGLVAAMFAAGKCNVLALGDKTAQGLGVNVLRAKIAVAGISVFLTAAAAANVGITAFLGLLAPMAARKILGAGHFRSVPLSAALGGVMLLGADCLGRALRTPVTLPVGIVTTVAGGAVFIVLIARGYRRAD